MRLNNIHCILSIISTLQITQELRLQSITSPCFPINLPSLLPPWLRLHQLHRRSNVDSGILIHALATQTKDTILTTLTTSQNKMSCGGKWMVSIELLKPLPWKLKDSTGKTWPEVAAFLTMKMNWSHMWTLQPMDPEDTSIDIFFMNFQRCGINGFATFFETFKVNSHEKDGSL